MHDLRDSIERCPPFGDYMGIDLGEFPVVLQTSGGTTGLPRPMLYSPRDREVTNIMGGRRFYLQGIRPGELVQSTYSIGLTNGGFATREALWKYTGAVPVMTGSGAATPTRGRSRSPSLGRQASARLPPPICATWRWSRATSSASIRARSVCARSARISGRRIGAGLEELWGAPVYDMYGTNESGMISCDCPVRDGMHVCEDAYFIEIADPTTNRSVPQGERGSVFITCLFKHAAPVIRFNVNDVSAFASGACACGGTHRRLQRIFGRSDNMVKLRGVNVFPEAIGALVTEMRAPPANMSAWSTRSARPRATR